MVQAEGAEWFLNPWQADRDESSPYAAMLAAQDVAARCKELGINALHIKIRATGGTLPALIPYAQQDVTC